MFDVLATLVVGIRLDICVIIFMEVFVIFKEKGRSFYIHISVGYDFYLRRILIG